MKRRYCNYDEKKLSQKTVGHVMTNKTNKAYNLIQLQSCAGKIDCVIHFYTNQVQVPRLFQFCSPKPCACD